jgi:hypothetical protein
MMVPCRQCEEEGMTSSQRGRCEVSRVCTRCDGRGRIRTSRKEFRTFYEDSNDVEFLNLSRPDIEYTAIAQTYEEFLCKLWERFAACYSAFPQIEWRHVEKTDMSVNLQNFRGYGIYARHCSILNCGLSVTSNVRSKVIDVLSKGGDKLNRSVGYEGALSLFPLDSHLVERVKSHLVRKGLFAHYFQVVLSNNGNSSKSNQYDYDWNFEVKLWKCGGGEVYG